MDEGVDEVTVITVAASGDRRLVTTFRNGAAEDMLVDRSRLQFWDPRPLTAAERALLNQADQPGYDLDEAAQRAAVSYLALRLLRTALRLNRPRLAILATYFARKHHLTIADMARLSATPMCSEAMCRIELCDPDLQRLLRLLRRYDCGGAAGDAR